MTADIQAAQPLTAELVRSLLRYEPETGKFFWKSRPLSMFPTEQNQRSWNTRFAGAEAFTTKIHRDHRRGCLFGRDYCAHRVAWLIMTGEWPELEVDHINGVESDNRWANLRLVTSAENKKNRNLQANNTSGANGVYWDKPSKKWRARVMVSGRYRSLGYFDSFDEAQAARTAAASQLGFSDRHGQEVSQKAKP